jgi:pimeloyl-ACP methyl ester carboxylesterase
MKFNVFIFLISIFSSSIALSSEVKMVKTEIAEVAVYGEVSKEKETIVFLHGVFLSHHIWDDYASHFKDRFNVVSLDWHGHGASTSSSRPWSLEDSVQVLNVIFESLSIDRAILVGHSWGGMAALRFADAYPEKVKTLVLYNTPLARLSKRSRLLQRLQKIALPLKSFYGKQAAQNIYSPDSLKKNPSWIEEVVNHFKSRSVTESRRVIKAVLLDAEDSFSLVDSLKVPSFFVVGKDDYVYQSYLANGNSGVLDRLHVISGGHVSSRESAQEGIALLKSFIE